jgi:MFS transporter, DHA1 family, multidrug resistance protein
VVDTVNPCRKTLFLRLGAIVFFAELAHGMLLYGIIPAILSAKFTQAQPLFGFLPAKAIEIAGYCLAAYVLAELAFKLPAGHLVDEKGPDLPLRIALIVSFVTVPLILMFEDPHLILVAAFLHGVGAAPIWPAVISAWTRGRSAAERGEIMGQILTAWMAGLGLGLIIGNVLVGLSGRQQLVAIYAPLVLWMVTIFAAIWRGRLGYPAHHGLSEDEKPAPFFSLSKELKVMAIGLLIQNLAFGALILTFQETVINDLLVHGISAPTRAQQDTARMQFGLLVLLGGGPAVFLMGPMGKLADRIGRRKAVIYSMLVVAPLIMITPLLKYFPGGPWVKFTLMIPGLLVAGVAYALLLPAWHALALGRIPEAQRGRSLALLMSIEMVALAGGHIAGPALYEKISYAAPFLFAGLTFAILAGLYWLGYILPAELPEEPHTVDLTTPASPNGSLPAAGLGTLRPEQGSNRAGE